MARRLIIGGLLAALLAWLAYTWMSGSEEPFNPDVHISGKNVLVTGASSGIGREMALLLCEMGANVYVTARRESLLQQVIEECRSRDTRGGKHGYLSADMEDMAQAEKLPQEAASFLGGLDYLILNHAYSSEDAMFYTTDEQGFALLTKTMAINFFSHIKITSAAMPHLLKTDGRIGVVSSVAGELPMPLFPEYFASKHAINGFYGSLDLDFYTRNINVSVTIVSPGVVDTEALQGIFRGIEKVANRELLESTLSMGQPRDCALEIIRSTALRRQHVYFPSDLTLWGASIIRKLFPKFTRDFSKKIHTKPN